jgi:hypothetical protein
MNVTVYWGAESCKSCRMVTCECDRIRIQLERSCYVFTVKDSPHPQASVTLGFLNTNFELNGIIKQLD